MYADINAQLTKVMLKQGEFKLTSGITANNYLDTYELHNHPHLMNILLDRLVKIVPMQVTRIGAVAHAATPLATLLANELNLPLTIVRAQGKEHGVKTPVQGEPKTSDIVFLLETLCSTGASLRHAIEKLAPHVAEIIPYALIIRTDEDVRDGGLENWLSHMFVFNGKLVSKFTRKYPLRFHTLDVTKTSEESLGCKLL